MEKIEPEKLLSLETQIKTSLSGRFQNLHYANPDNEVDDLWRQNA